MNVPFATMAMVALVFAAVGWPAARLLARSRVGAWATLPASTGIACSVAVAAAILTGSSMVPWLATMAVLGWAGLALRRATGHRWAPEHDPTGVPALVTAAVVAILPVILVDIPPVEADARYMWWFHAAWYRHGGDVTSEAMSLPDFFFRRPAYPPLLPGVIATVWHVGGAFDREVALRVSQLFTGAAVAAAGFFTARTLRLDRRDTAVAAGFVAAACWGANASVGLVGFVDLAWAALFVAAAVLLLAGPTDSRTIAIGTAFAAAAALVKFEGEVAALLLVVLVAVRAGRAWRRSVPVAAAVIAAIAGWRFVPAAAGAPPDQRGEWDKLPQILDTGSEAHRRLMDALDFLGGELGWLVGLAALAIVVTLVVARLGGRPLRQPGVVPIMVLVAGYLTFVALTFAMAPESLDSFLDAAARRVVLVARMLVVVDALLVGVAAARAIGHLEPVLAPTAGAGEGRDGAARGPGAGGATGGTGGAHRDGDAVDHGDGGPAGADRLDHDEATDGAAGTQGGDRVQRDGATGVAGGPEGGGGPGDGADAAAGGRPGAARASVAFAWPGPGRRADALAALVIGAFVLVRAGLYAASGAGLILDDWSIVVNGGLNRLWEDPNTTFALSRPGAWVLLTVVNGGIGAHPLGLLAVITLLQLTAAWLLYRVALRWVTPAVALAVTVLWLVMANHSSLTVWGPIIPALVALCLLLGGVLALASGRWVLATACFCVAALCYETTLPAAAVATLVLPATPRVAWSRRAVTLALLGAIGIWIAAHPIYDVPLHLPALGVFWDAHFGRGLLGTDQGAPLVPTVLRLGTLAGIAWCLVRWWQGERRPGSGPWLVIVGLAVGALGALGWVTLDPQAAPLGVFDRILVVSSLGAAAVWAGILLTAWAHARVPTAAVAVVLLVVCVAGQVVTLGSWSRAGRDVEVLVDHVAGLSQHPGAHDFVVGPSPVRLDHHGVAGVYTEGFANDAATVAFGDDRGSLTIAEGPTSFTSEGQGTLIDWSDVFGGTPVPYQDLVGGSPKGYLEVADRSAPGVVVVAGWVIDLSDQNIAVNVTIRVDSEAVDIGVAQLPRPDVAASYPDAGPNHGFSAELPVGPGPHLVCAIGVNVGEGVDAPLLAGDAPGRIGTYCIRVG